LVLNRWENFFKSQWNDFKLISSDFGGQILSRGLPHFHTQLRASLSQDANLNLVIFCRNNHAKDRSIKQCQTWEQDKIPFHFLNIDMVTSLTEPFPNKRAPITAIN